MKKNNKLDKNNTKNLPKGDGLSLPKGWVIKKLGEVCEIRSGRDYKKVIVHNGKYPIIGSAGKPMGYTNQFICEAGTTIIGRKGTINSPMFIETNFWNVDTAFGFHALDVIEKRYLFLFCLFFDFAELDKGSGRPSLVKKDLKEILIPIPPLSEQKRIVSKLDTLFAEIEAIETKTKQNLENTQELFQSYLQGVFENKGDDWEEKKLGEVCEIEYGFTDKAQTTGMYRYIRITDIDYDGLLSNKEKLYIDGTNESKRFILKQNDLLMARTGATFAKVLLYENREPSIFASYLIRIKFITQINNKLYWYFSKSAMYWEQANQLSSGAAQPQFNGNAVKQVVFPFPKSLSEQQRIVENLDSLSAETKKLESVYQEKLLSLSELKKSILDKAFKGEL